MLDSKAYGQAYGYIEYKKARDYSDLITAFANDLEQVEIDYLKYGYPKRKRKFDSSNAEEAELHKICTPNERHIDVAFDHLKDFVINPNEPVIIQKFYDFRIKSWNDTPANRLENKIENSKRIIEWFQEEYGVVLRKSYYYENCAIYVGNGNYAKLPKDANYTLIAQILFRDIHKEWKETDIIYELSLLKQITPHTAEYDQLFKTSVKRMVQHINDNVAKAANEKIKLLNHTNKTVSFNLDLFHQIDRVLAQ